MHVRSLSCEAVSVKGVALATTIACLLAEAACGWLVQSAHAQTAQPVVIERQLLAITPVEQYRQNIQLQPVRQVTLTAPFDGVVSAVLARPGARMEEQSDLVRFDARRITLLLKAAQAAHALAEAELRQARETNNAQVIQLAEARLAVADASLGVALFDSEQTTLHAPFGGRVMATHIQEGQRIQAGSPIVTIADTTSLICRVPVHRKESPIGSRIAVTIEDTTAEAVVESVEPLPDDRQQLRELGVSVAVAVLKIDNREAKFAAGQAVYSTLLPEAPVTRVPINVLQTTSSGGRAVPVLRNRIVKHIPVRLHGQIGTSDLFVSGMFLEGDEAIISSSIELADGTAVRPSAGGQGGGPSSNPASDKPAGQPANSAGTAGF